ncbi:MAG: AsmA family protein [Verrucomicrobiales bacterium]|nr:AsmA family protein [Verrucomicrobiales bacterium]
MAVLAITVFIGVFAIKGAVTRYLKSTAFRDQLITAVGEKLHADVELEQLRWEGSTIYADGWRARGHPQAAFAKLEMDGIRASFSGVKDKLLQLPEIRINQVTADFSKQGRTPITESPLANTDKTNHSGSAPAWLKKWIPTGTKIGVVHIEATNLSIHDEHGVKQVALNSVETQSKPLAGPRTWEINARNGELFIRDFPTLSIRHLETRWNQDDLFINDASLIFYETAEISGSGDIQLGAKPQLNFDLKLQHLDTSKLLSSDWQKKLSGQLNADFTLKGSSKDKNGLVSKGSVHLKNGAIEGMPILDLIAQYTKMQRFKRLALHQASADFVKKGDRIEISKLVLQSDGLTRLEGSFVLENNQITQGKFQLGVTPGTLRWIPGAKQKVFTRAKDGFLWTPLVISGSLDQPKEDLTARLTGAAIEALVNDAPAQATDAAKKILNNPSDAIDTGKKLLDSLIPLFK